MRYRSLVGELVIAAALAGAGVGGGGCGEPMEVVYQDLVSPPVLDLGSPPPPPPPDQASTACATAPQCAAEREQKAVDRFDALVAQPADLALFLRAVPKGGDLHNHLTGAVYAETLLDWARTDGDCINTSTFSAVFASQCTTGTQPAPMPGTFYDQVVRAWSMLDFVPGAQTGRDHFFATFGKYGAIVGAHRDDNVADVARRAADENQLYVETMFNLGRNVGNVAASAWSGTLTATDLPAFHTTILGDPGFAAALASDVAVVDNAAAGHRTVLGCTGGSPPAACQVTVRFVAQVSRTGANDQIFGQLVSAFEMASRTPNLVAVNLSSPEDDVASLSNYDLHMAMLDFLYQKYTLPQLSPLHVTLHAGELVPKYLPTGYEGADTFHIRAAVEIAHAERIGHGIDLLSENDPAGLMAEMRNRDVLVEVCLASNDQILEVRGAAHPLAQYLQDGVSVALATDDQGVSRSSLAGEYLRAALDQQLGYRQLKTMARDSLQHSFLPGARLFAAVAIAQPVTECAATDTMALGDTPNPSCQQFLAGSERARLQWELERRFLAFEASQP